MDLSIGFQDITAFFYIQGLGLIGFVVAVTRLQLLNMRTIIVMIMIACIFFGLQALVLGALVGAIMPFAAATRSFITLSPLEGRPKWTMIIIVLSLAAAIAIVHRESDLGLLVIATPFLMAYAEGQSSALIMRLVTVINDSLWIVYNVSVGNVGGTLCAVSCIASSLVGIVRLDLPQMPAYQRVFAKI